MMNVLLHACCGPCAVFPVQHFRDKNIDFTAYFFNPNIHPLEEHLKRKETLQEFADSEKFDLIVSDEFAQSDWEDTLGASHDRCKLCYQIRLGEVARRAKLGGFDAFSTTLLISPYQNHELLREIGEELSKEFGIGFYYQDFRPNFRDGQNKAREIGLYRQKYCGCINSLAERER